MTDLSIEERLSEAYTEAVSLASSGQQIKDLVNLSQQAFRLYVNDASIEEIHSKLTELESELIKRRLNA